MSAIFDHQDHERHRFWNTAPADPVALAKKVAVPYQRGGRIRPLGPDDFMPVGEHAGKTMRQVPVAYLSWVNEQPWAATWRHWEPVADYLTRHALEAEAGRSARAPVIFCDTLTPCAPEPGWRFESYSRLYCTCDDHAPYLHAFAIGALGLERRHYQEPAGALPHYRLSEVGQERALGLGAELADRRTAQRHEWAMNRTPFVRVMEDGTQRCTKHCYTKVEAETARNDRLDGRKHRRNTRPEFLRIYECTHPECGFWHLTSKP